MSKRVVKWLAGIFCCALLAGAAIACDKGDDALTFKDGSEIPGEVTAELGGVYIIPELSNSDVVVTVKNGKGEEVRVNNYKFRIEDLDGYMITYTVGNVTASTTIKVTDTGKPIISVNVPDNMVVVPDSEVIIPTCLVSDMGSPTLTADISVKMADGEDVEVVDGKFIASKIGDYLITYTATDPSGNTGEKILRVSCRMADMLNDFEEAEDVGYIAAISKTELVTENASNGNGMKITIDDPTENQWRKISIPLTKDGEYISWKKLQEYDRVQLYVYASDANELGLAHATWPIQKGLNVITFNRAQIQAGYAFSDHQYKENGTEGFYLNLRYAPNGFSLILDNFIGIYPDNYVPPQPENFTMEVNGTDGMLAIVGQPFTPPVCTVKDLEGNDLAYSYKITDISGNEVELTDGVFTPTEVGEYSVIYTITSEGYTGTREIEISAKQGVALNGCESLEDIYGISGFTADVTLVDEHTMSGHGVQIASTSGGSWVQVYMPLNGITLAQLQKFEKIAFNIYAGVGSTISIANGDPAVNLVKGYNIVTFTTLQIMKAYEFSDWQYREAEGFYLTFPAIGAGDTFVFDGAIGIYADDYVPAPDNATMTVKGMNGMTVTLGKENSLPPCIVTDNDGNEVGYTVTVKDESGNDVTVTDGKFTPAALGQYTITYSAEGFEDVSITVNCKKGNVLNTFANGSDITYISGSWYETTLTDSVSLTDKGIKITSSKASGNWANIYLPLTVNGKVITLNQLKAYEKLQFYIYSTTNSSLLLGSGSPEVALTEGWNIVELTMADLLAGGLEEKGLYQENANGIVLAISEFLMDRYMVFDAVIGIYADDFDESSQPEEPEPEVPEIPAAPEQTVEGELLNNFDDTADITYLTSKNCTTEVVEQGVKLTATAAANWINIYIPLMKDGNYLTLTQIKAYEKLSFCMYTSVDTAFCLASGAPQIALTAGWNDFEVSMTDLLAGGLEGVFAENANGLAICSSVFPQDAVIILNRVVGVGYVAPEEPEPEIPEIPTAPEQTVEGTVLNDFDATTDVTYITSADCVTAVDEQGVKMTANADANWVNFYLPLTMDGGYLTAAQLKAHEKLSFCVYTSVATNFCLGTGSPSIALTAGWNEFDMAIADLEGSLDKMYSENANGLILCLSAFPKDAFVIFKRVVGVGYVAPEPEIPEAQGDLLNDFTALSDVTYVSGGACATEQDPDGVKVTAATADANWVNIYVPLAKDGAFLTLAQVKGYEKLQFRVYSSVDTTFGIASGNPMKPINVGWNTVEFTLEELIAGSLDTMYSENANGLILCLSSFPQGAYLIFDSIIGL